MPALENDVIRIASEGSLSVAAQAVVNVFHYQITTLVDGDPDVITAELKIPIEDFYTDLLTICDTTWSMSNLSFENVTQGILYDDLPIDKVGLASDDALPSQVAALIIGRTASLRVQGRKYLGGLTEAQTSFGGQWTVAALTAMGLAKDVYKAAVAGLSGNLYDPGVFRPDPILPIFTPFTSGAVIQFARTQRSRTQVLGFA